MHDGTLLCSIRRFAGAIAVIGVAGAGTVGCAMDMEEDPSTPDEVATFEPGQQARPAPPPTVADAEVHSETVANEAVYDDSDWDVPATDLTLAPAVAADQGDRVGQRLAFEGDLKKRLDAIDGRVGKVAARVASGEATLKIEAIKASRGALERERNDLPLCSEEKWPEAKARIDTELASIEALLAELEAN